MATHSSVLAWRIPGMEKPGGLPSMGFLFYVTCCFSLAAFNILSLCLFFVSSISLETKMATHSSFLAWRIPGMEKPGGLLSMGSHRVGHD